MATTLEQTVIRTAQLNPQDVQRAGDPKRITPGRLYIDGEWRDAKDGGTKPTTSPIDEQPITDIAQATDADVQDAVAAARRAFEGGDWPAMNSHDRAKLLIRIADLVDEHADELAYRETVDMGKPIAMSRGFDAPMMAQLFRYFAGVAQMIEGATRGGTHPTAIPVQRDGVNYTLREPLGVVAAITPFNFPLLLSGTKLAAALASGNTVIHKPASDTPLSAIKMAEIMDEAGVPKGVFNLITGPGKSIGDTIVKHPDVDKIAFTGSTAVGKGIIRNSADTIKHTTMELGGKSANIVFADADLDAAVQNAYFGIFYNKGEICTAGSRLLVERSVHDEVVERLIALANQAVKGDPRDPATTFGPLASKEQWDKVTGYVDIGQKEGATLRLGGKPFRPPASAGIPDGKGFYYEPTIFTDVTRTMRIFQEEIFGPVLAVTAFDTEAEAVDLANGTIYGLASGVQTSDLKRAHRVARDLKAGIVWVNTYNQFDSTTPFGGYKQSGYGRELGTEVLESYTQTKSVWIDLS